MIIMYCCSALVVKVWIQEELQSSNKIGMGLVMSHTYNLSHACLSHTHTVKHPTSVALLHIEGNRVARYRNS